MRLTASELAREAGATGFLTEPFEKVLVLLELLEAIRRHPFLKERVVEGTERQAASRTLIAVDSPGPRAAASVLRVATGPEAASVPMPRAARAPR